MNRKWILVALLGAIVCDGPRIRRRHPIRRLQPRLPEGARPAGRLGSLRLYAPWSWLTWASDFGPYAPAIFRIVKAIGWVSILAPWVPLLIAVRVSRAAGRQHRPRLGDLGRHAELQKAGMLGRRGRRPLPDQRRPLHRRRQAGRLPRSRGRAGSSPTTVPSTSSSSPPRGRARESAPSSPRCSPGGLSALVYDIKKELWTRTAGWRRQFSRCWRFEPTARRLRSASTRCSRSAAATARSATFRTSPTSSSTRTALGEARSLEDVGPHAPCRRHPPRPLRREGQVAGRPSLGSSQIRKCPIYDTFQRMLITRHLPSGPHPVVAQCAREMLDKSENELASIVSTAKTCVNLYNDPLIARNTAHLRLPDRRPDERRRAGQPLPGRRRPPTSTGPDR